MRVERTDWFNPDGMIKFVEKISIALAECRMHDKLIDNQLTKYYNCRLHDLDGSPLRGFFNILLLNQNHYFNPFYYLITLFFKLPPNSSSEDSSAQFIKQ